MSVDRHGNLNVSQEVDVDVSIDLDEHYEDIIEYFKKSGKLSWMPSDKYNELRDQLHYSTVTQEEFMAQLDEMMGYKRNG